MQMTRATAAAEEAGGTPEDVATAVVEALESDEPRSRIFVGPTLQQTARRLLPDRIWDSLLLRSIRKL
jgi:hypothetical protein